MPRKQTELDAHLADLRRLYGDNLSLFSSRHHARYHDPSVPYHVIARIFQGRCLLTPSAKLNDVINGVIGRAQELWPNVQLYAHAFLSNHVHWMLQGSPEDIPSFIGFIKREVSRRCAPLVGWKGDTMWSRQYWSTALPTASAQINCLRYVASQSVKEGLVERPEQWPGVHCAKQLWANKVVTGTWLDGTRYGKARYKQSLRPKNRRHAIDKSVYTKRYEVRLCTIPPWRGLSKATLEANLAAMHREIVKDGKRCRGDKPALGAKGVMGGNRRRVIPIARPPWFEERRRMVCWSHPSAAQTKRYLAAYWEFQLAYRQASEAYLAGDDGVAFPPGAFKPSVFAARRAGRQPLAV